MKTIRGRFSNFLLFLAVLLFVMPIQAKTQPSDSATKITPGAKVFVFNPRSLTWTVYGSNGKVIRSGHAVGGQGYCKDVKRGCRTPSGTYRIYSKHGPNYISSRFPLPRGGAPMPYAMFFHKGFAIHGSNALPNRNASHGCIRVSPSEARWLNTKVLPVGTKVIVRSY